MKAYQRNFVFPSAEGFKARAERLFYETNPTAVITGWVREPEVFEGRAPGYRYMYGTFHAVAEGFHPRVMKVDLDPDMMTIR